MLKFRTDKGVRQCKVFVKEDKLAMRENNLRYFPLTRFLRVEIYLNSPIIQRSI